MTNSSEVYQGQFGEFTITEGDRLGVIIYRLGLTLAAVSFTVGSGLILTQGPTSLVLSLLTLLFALFSLGLGISLLTIHIYLLPLHRFLQICWGMGTISAVLFGVKMPQPLGLFVYEHPISLLGIGFSFVALTGIYFKEAFCFNRLETKVLTFVVPVLLSGHLIGFLPLFAEKLLLTIWGALFLIFVMRKFIQPIPQDIGDKSVFEYLKQQRFSENAKLS